LGRRKNKQNKANPGFDEKPHLSVRGVVKVRESGEISWSSILRISPRLSIACMLKWGFSTKPPILPKWQTRPPVSQACGNNKPTLAWPPCRSARNKPKLPRAFTACVSIMDSCSRRPLGGEIRNEPNAQKTGCRPLSFKALRPLPAIGSWGATRDGYLGSWCQGLLKRASEADGSSGSRARVHH
jgi:hypothetical protein